METACSSSLVAIAMAVASLQQGDCDTALVTGLNYLNEKDFHLSLQVRPGPRLLACLPAPTWLNWIYIQIENSTTHPSVLEPPTPTNRRAV